MAILKGVVFLTDIGVEEDFRHHPKIVGHILEGECAQVLRDFFSQMRKKCPENLKIL